MKKLILNLVVAGAAALAVLPAHAQHARVSPHETISAVIDGDRVTVVYGRPYTKDRKIWGGLVPYGQVWRTGADEATLLVTQKPLMIGETTIPAGAYTLYTLPEENGGKLIINKAIGQWGTQYDQGEDLARVDLKKTTLETPVHQFTIAISREQGGGGVLKLMWEDAQYSVPFKVVK